MESFHMKKISKVVHENENHKQEVKALYKYKAFTFFR
jgi:hypothetical protein